MSRTDGGYEVFCQDRLRTNIMIANRYQYLASGGGRSSVADRSFEPRTNQHKATPAPPARSPRWHEYPPSAPTNQYAPPPLPRPRV